jgi:S1-C subfamily serine protease
MMLLGGCGTMPGGARMSAIPDYALASCGYVIDANFTTCSERARSGRNGNVAMAVATYLSQTSDAESAFEWTQDAAAWGNSRALRTIYDAYYYGNDRLAEDKDAAAKTLDSALANGAQWARLLQASRIWTTSAPEAHSLITAAAAQNNCHAQAFLANAYYDGSLGERNWTKAYFWLLLSQSGSTARLSEIHALTLSSAKGAFMKGAGNETCTPDRLPILKASMDRALPARYVLNASNAASRWRPNASEPDLAAPPDDAMVEMQPQTPPPSRTPKLLAVPAQMPQWQLISFDRTANRAERQLSNSELFARAGKFVWAVNTSAAQPGSASQGSAVAIGPHRLITNCHVVDEARAIVIRQGKDMRSAILVSASPETDRCVLSVDKRLPAHARAIRAFDTLKIGEPVVSIGSAYNFETVLSQGMVSGLRRRDTMRVVQTTAPSPPDSTGGGVFDGAGNLIGITSRDMNDADSHNVAIAAEDFGKAK